MIFQTLCFINQWHIHISTFSTLRDESSSHMCSVTNPTILFLVFFNMNPRTGFDWWCDKCDTHDRVTTLAYSLLQINCIFRVGLELLVRFDFFLFFSRFVLLGIWGATTAKWKDFTDKSSFFTATIFLGGLRFNELFFDMKKKPCKLRPTWLKCMSAG